MKRPRRPCEYPVNILIDHIDGTSSRDRQGAGSGLATPSLACPLPRGRGYPPELLGKTTSKVAPRPGSEVTSTLPP
jgi:hypothetical protein